MCVCRGEDVCFFCFKYDKLKRKKVWPNNTRIIFRKTEFFFFVKFVVISPLVLHVTRASIGVAFSNDCRDSMADILDPSSTGSLDR